MAMGGAYVLADELAKAGSDVPGALRRYQERVKPSIEKKQKAGRRIANWFVPKNNIRRWVSDIFTRMVDWPVLWRLAKWQLEPGSIIER